MEFAVHSLAPNEAANGVAVSHGPAVPVPAADNTSAAVLPGAEVTSGRIIRCDGWTILWAGTTLACSQAVGHALSLGCRCTSLLM